MGSPPSSLLCLWLDSWVIFIFFFFLFKLSNRTFISGLTNNLYRQSGFLRDLTDPGSRFDCGGWVDTRWPFWVLKLFKIGIFSKRSNMKYARCTYTRHQKKVQSRFQAPVNLRVMKNFHDSFRKKLERELFFFYLPLLSAFCIRAFPSPHPESDNLKECTRKKLLTNLVTHALEKQIYSHRDFNNH